MFQLLAPQPDKVPLRDHLLSVQRQTGEVPELLEEESAAEIAAEPVMYLMDYFGSLSLRRGRPEMGQAPITNLEIESWARLHRVQLSVFEIEALDRLESVFLKYARGTK